MSSKLFSAQKQKLCQKLMSTLDESDEKEWTSDQRKILSELIKITDCSDLLKTLNRQNSLCSMVSDANPRLKILIDHSLRYFPHFPPAQVTLHLPDDSPADMFAPRQPFDLPIFFYQCCPLEKSIIEADFLSVQSLQLGFNNINKDVEVVLQNDRAVFTVSTEDGTRELTFEEIGTFGQNTYYKHESTELNWDQQYSNESVLIDGSRIMLKDGAIFDYTRNKCIPVYLNNVCIDKMKIEKISIHKFEDRVEVFILFDRFFMARGWIRKPQTGISNSRWICDVTEIPGSLGTTNFHCSPNFKSILRVSQMKRKRTSTAYSFVTSNEWRARENECKQMISALLPEVRDKCYQRINEDLFSHRNQRAPFIDELCPLFHLNMLVLQKLKSKRTELRNNWTFREWIHWFYYTEMTEICKTSKQKHCSDGQCQVIIDFLDECREFLHSKTIINVGFHAEFGKQLFNSLFALHRILINNVPPNKESLKIIKCEINPVNIYSLTPDDILTLFPLFPKHFKPMALDVICQNAIPETYSYILKLYGVEDYSNRKEKKANRTLILNALKKHPYILLFCNTPSRLSVGLIKAFGDYMDQCNKREVYYDIDPDDTYMDIESEGIETSRVSMKVGPSEPKNKHVNKDFQESPMEGGQSRTRNFGSQTSNQEDSFDTGARCQSVEDESSHNESQEQELSNNGSLNKEQSRKEHSKNIEIPTVSAVKSISPEKSNGEELHGSREIHTTEHPLSPTLEPFDSSPSCSTLRKRHGAGSAFDLDKYLEIIKTPTQRRLGEKLPLPRIVNSPSRDNKFVEEAPDYLPNRAEMETTAHPNGRKRKTRHSPPINLRNRQSKFKRKLYDD